MTDVEEGANCVMIAFDSVSAVKAVHALWSLLYRTSQLLSLHFIK